MATKISKIRGGMRQCHNCGHSDIGSYCSKCGAQLKHLNENIFLETFKEIFSFDIIRTWIFILTNSVTFFKEYLEGNFKNKSKPISFFLITYSFYIALGQLFSSPINAITYYDVLIELNDSDNIVFQNKFFPEYKVESIVDSSRINEILDTNRNVVERIFDLITYGAELEMQKNAYYNKTYERDNSYYWENRYIGDSDYSERVKSKVGSILAEDVSQYLYNNGDIDLSYKFNSIIKSVTKWNNFSEIILKLLTPLFFFAQIGFVHWALTRNERSKRETTKILMYYFGYYVVIGAIVEVITWNLAQSEIIVTVVKSIVALLMLTQAYGILKFTHNATLLRQLFAFGMPILVIDIIHILIIAFVLV